MPIIELKRANPMMANGTAINAASTARMGDNDLALRKSIAQNSSPQMAAVTALTILTAVAIVLVWHPAAMSATGEINGRP